MTDSTSTARSLTPTGSRTPQQARSRAALQRLLAAAQDVLANDGIDEFTIARVAEQAGVSVGGVYRRFASKEQLIEAVRHELLARLEDTVTEALDTADPSLAGVITAFTTALSAILAESGHVIPAMLASGHRAGTPEQVPRTFATVRQRFLDAVAPYRDQIRHPDPSAALNVAFRSVIAASVHRAATAPWWPDGLDWQQWAGESAAMATSYLTSEPQNPTAAT